MSEQQERPAEPGPGDGPYPAARPGPEAGPPPNPGPTGTGSPPGHAPGHGAPAWRAGGQAPRGAGPRSEEFWPGAAAFAIKPPHPVPTEVQRAFLLWMAVAGLMAVNFVLSILFSVGSAAQVGSSIGSALFALLFAVPIAFGAVQMRLGRSWGRIVAAIAGGVLGLLQLIGLIGALALLGLLGSLLGGAIVFMVLLSLLIVLGGLALVIAAMVYTFRPAVNEYLAAQR